MLLKYFISYTFFIFHLYSIEYVIPENLYLFIKALISISLVDASTLSVSDIFMVVGSSTRNPLKPHCLSLGISTIRYKRNRYQSDGFFRLNLANRQRIAGVELETLYENECPSCYKQDLTDFVASGFLYQLSVLNDVSKAIKEGNNDDARQDLYNLYNKNLNKAVEQVFKPDSSNPLHRDYYYKMQANACKFSAYKAEYFTNALQKAWQKSPEDYDANAKKILQTANRFQITEYNTTVARCRTARQFSNFKQNQDLFPNLEWIRTRSSHPRELHLSYVGLILPMSDPFWAENQPGNLYNCKCDWRQTNKPATNAPNTIVKPAVGLEGNPCTTREMYTDKHPYFAKATDEAKKTN